MRLVAVFAGFIAIFVGVALCEIFRKYSVRVYFREVWPMRLLGKSAVRRSLAALSSADQKSRLGALNTIQEAGFYGWLGRTVRKEAMIQLQRVIREPDAEIRREAALALKKIIMPLDILTSGDARIQLYEMVLDPEDRVRRAVCIWIGIGGKDKLAGDYIAKAWEQGKLGKSLVAEAFVALQYETSAAVGLVCDYLKEEFNKWINDSSKYEGKCNEICKAILYLGFSGDTRGAEVLQHVGEKVAAWIQREEQRAVRSNVIDPCVKRDLPLVGQMEESTRIAVEELRKRMRVVVEA